MCFFFLLLSYPRHRAKESLSQTAHPHPMVTCADWSLTTGSPRGSVYGGESMTNIRTASSRDPLFNSSALYPNDNPSLPLPYPPPLSPSAFGAWAIKLREWLPPSQKADTGSLLHWSVAVTRRGVGSQTFILHEDAGDEFRQNLRWLPNGGMGVIKFPL